LFDADTLEAETPRLANPSDVVFAEVGAHGVSEAAALAQGGADAVLTHPKRKTANATCALATAPAPLVDLRGRSRGRLSIVGIGPGQAAWRTPEVSRLVSEAEELVGMRAFTRWGRWCLNFWTARLIRWVCPMLPTGLRLFVRPVYLRCKGLLPVPVPHWVMIFARFHCRIC